MKKRLLSALLAFCLACSLAGAAFADDIQLAVPDVSASEPLQAADAVDKEQAPAETDDTEIPAEEKIATAETAAEPVYPARTFEAAVSGADITVRVSAPEGALPEGAVLTAALVGTSEDEDQVIAEVARELDNAAVEYDGFVALDISFEDGNGNGVEPLQPVDVNFTLPAELLPENVQVDSLQVQHLKEDVVTQEVVSVETVADTSDAVDGTVTVEGASAMSAEMDAGLPADAAVAAEFTVDGFSFFTISYNKNNDVQVYLVDEKGEPLWDGAVDFSDLSAVYNPTDFADKWIADQWVSVEELAATWASKTEGYEYIGAYKNSDLGPGNQIFWIMYHTDRPSGWYYRSTEQRPGSNGTEYGDRWWRNPKLYLVYTKVDDVSQSGALQIEDRVKSDGTFQASYSQPGTDYYYVWEKSDTGLDYEPITRLKMNGDQYNLTENGQSLNVALEVTNDPDDVGGQWFRVSVYTNKASYEQGASALATSQAMQLPYYDELRNGSFEAPKVNDLSTGTKSNYQYPVGSEKLIWRTTGEDQQIEIVDGINDKTGRPSDYNNSDGAKEGRQYAELNCETAGALYQDVLTVPGTSLNWQLYHRGRDGVDTMYLLIAPTSGVEDVTTQAQLENLISNIKENPDWYSGYYLYELSDNNTAWVRYSSDSTDAQPYTVPDGQYLTRFFFVAGDTASKKSTVGNLLDDVKFTTALLPPQPGTASLRIEKTVTGVGEADIEGYSLTVKVTDGIDGSLIGKVELQSFTQDQQGNWHASGQVTGIKVQANQSRSVKVQEVLHVEPEGYRHVSTTLTGFDSTDNQNLQGTKTLSEGSTQSVGFTNAYEATNTDLTITKTFVGLSENEANEVWSRITYTTQDKKESQKVSTSVTESNGSYTAIATISGLQIGRTYTITENNAMLDGYTLTTTATGVGGDQSVSASNPPNALIVTAASNNRVEFSNTYARQTGTLTLKKTVVLTGTAAGEDSEKAKAIPFTFQVVGPVEATGTYTVGDNEVIFTRGEDGNSAVARVQVTENAAVAIPGLPIGPYTVTEVNPDPEILDESYYFDSTVSGNGQGTSVPLTQNGAEATITNTYTPYRTVTVEKVVNGNMGDTTRAFAFTSAQIKQGVDNITASDPGAELTQQGFTLTNGGWVVLSKVKKGESITVSEQTVEGYQTAVTVRGAENTATGNTATVNVGDQDVTIIYTNTRQIVTPTGLEDNHTKPFGLMMAVAALAGLALAGGTLARRRRRRE